MSERIEYTEVSPEGVEALGDVYHYVTQSGLSDVLVELVYLRVSQINGCAYCVDMHTRALINKGVSADKLVLVPLWREASSLFDKREQAALGWAETVTRVAETGVPGEHYRTARDEFSEKELVDLTIAIGLMNTYNRMAISFRKPPRIWQRPEWAHRRTRVSNCKRLIRAATTRSRESNSCALNLSLHP